MSDMPRSDMPRSDMRGSDMRRSDMRGSDMRGSDMRGSDMRGSDMRGSDMRGSDMRGSTVVMLVQITSGARIVSDFQLYECNSESALLEVYQSVVSAWFCALRGPPHSAVRTCRPTHRLFCGEINRLPPVSEL